MDVLRDLSRFDLPGRGAPGALLIDPRVPHVVQGLPRHGTLLAHGVAEP